MTSPLTFATEWLGKPNPPVTEYTLLTPPPGLLTTVSQLGGYTVDELSGLLVTAGYEPPTGTEWTRV